MLPKEVTDVICRLESFGHEAYAVGGCVRDMLMGRTASDFDVATSAAPGETKVAFSDCKVIETGIAHGTVSVLQNGEMYEITTFRCDGEYKDSRHPDSVSFTKSIEEDLARRDFTVNSMAMDKDGKVIDPFGGQEDLKQGFIRCTGEAEKRFLEDALRILRALRFAAVLDFKIEDKTAAAIHSLKENIKKVSVERIFTELKKLLCGKGVFRVLSEFSDVLCVIIPEMKPCVGFDHKSKYHIYDVYTHILKTVEAIEPDPILRLTMLLHDIGKPEAATEERTEEGEVRHFKGHPEISERMADVILRRLRADNSTVKTVTTLCRYHDRQIVPKERPVRRLFLKMSFEEIILLCKVRIADSAAHNPEYDGRGDEAREIMALAEKINRENQCVKITDLEVKGNDLIGLGLRGKEIGEVLEMLLKAVIDEKVQNERDSLLAYIKKTYNGIHRSKLNA